MTRNVTSEDFARLRAKLEGKPLQAELNAPRYVHARLGWCVVNSVDKSEHWFDTQAEAQRFYDGAVK